jgi:hypothetical protein
MVNESPIGQAANKMKKSARSDLGRFSSLIWIAGEFSRQRRRQPSHRRRASPKRHGVDRSSSLLDPLVPVDSTGAINLTFHG